MFTDFSDKSLALGKRLTKFMDDYIYPNESVFNQQLADAQDRWQPLPIVEQLKSKARDAGLWNLFLPASEFGAGLTNVDYAPLAEIMGRVSWASEIFNCSAPDTGNMETLTRYGTPNQQKQWLKLLLEGEIRSCFSMTEPAVASSDATNMQATGRPDGNSYILNGRKWFSTGACYSRCKIAIFMCLTNPQGPRHQQHSMILVPLDTAGVTLVRPLSVFGYDHAPHGHAEILFNDVRVPKENILLGPGRGFEIAQGRLGPGRIHHCMRAIGLAERALEMMCKRSLQRVAFGQPLSFLGGTVDTIANSRIEIEMARLLTLKAAYMMDTVGNKAAASAIAQIKVAAPNVACRVIDRAIQLHGGAGVTSDFPLAYMYSSVRGLRIVDGPDEVHRKTIAKKELARYKQ